MTKSKLAEAAGCTLRTIVNYETGSAEPPPARVEELARILQYPSEFFTRPDVELLDAAGVSFRSLSRMRASQRDRALAAAEMAFELSAWIGAKFELPPPNLPDLSALRSPDAAAATLRSMWGLGDKPISNMVRLLEANGVRVFSLAEEHDALDGYSFWRDGTPFIFLNTVKSAERSRFDSAHELAHLVLHRHGDISRRDIEGEAQTFASAFLMPESSVAAYAPRFPTLSQLIQAKRGWGVSVGALAYRMRAMGMLSEWQYRSLCIEIGSAGYRTEEPNPAPREQSLAFEKIFKQLRDDGVTKQVLAASLGWPLSELNALVFGLVLSKSVTDGELDRRADGPLGGTVQRLTLVE